MGCTHSKNSKSKPGVSKSEQPLEQRANQRVAHFDETQPNTPSTSVDESEEHQPQQMNHYTKNLLNETRESTYQKTSGHNKSSKKLEVQATTVVDQHISNPTQNKNQSSELPIEKMESIPHTAVPPTYHQKQYAASTYYPMPTIGEKQKSPEKKKTRKVEEEKKKKKEQPAREKSMMIGPNYRPQLSQEDLDYIKRSVQQRNERRAYMMAHRNETDDTLYELEVRMPEKDYTNRIEVTQNSRAY